MTVTTIESPYVTHAPARDGEAALCGSTAEPRSILVCGPVSAVDCPGCGAKLESDEGMQEAVEGSQAARALLYGEPS